LATKPEERGGGEVTGKGLILVHVADAGEGAPLRYRATESEHSAPTRMAQAQEDLEQGRFAGPVGAQKGKHLSRFNPQADPTQGLDRPAGMQRCPVRLGNISELG